MPRSPKQVPSNRPSRESLRAEAKHLYVDRKLSTRAAAAAIGVSTPVLRALLEEQGIARRSISEGKAGQRPTAQCIEKSVRARRKRSLPGRPAVGYKINEDGYVLLWLPGHPLADAAGYVKEHRLVLSQKIGRLLLPHEDAHHRNHVRHDNDPGNLFLKDSRSEHQREHSATRNRRPDGSFAPDDEGAPKIGNARCSVVGCDRSARRRGWCSSHWFWARNHNWQAPIHLIGAGRHYPRPGRRKKTA